LRLEDSRGGKIATLTSKIFYLWRIKIPNGSLLPDRTKFLIHISQPVKADFWMAEFPIADWGLWIAEFPIAECGFRIAELRSKRS
jgi:hypothetical protein